MNGFQGAGVGHNLSMVNVLSRLIAALNQSQAPENETGVCGTERLP
jgi:hypothetical protein